MRRAGPRFVFLEGAAGTGKSSICTELAARGHRVHFESFVELCDLHPQYQPGQLVMSFKWANDIICRMEEFSRTSQKLVFFDRSLLTPYVYARTDRHKLSIYPALMEEMASVFDCSVVLLHTHQDVVQQRLLDRYNRSTPAEKLIRESLNELNQDFVAQINARYEELANAGAFRFRFDTSKGSPAENTDGLLERLEKRD